MASFALALFIVAFILFLIEAIPGRSLIAYGLAALTLGIILLHGNPFHG